MCLFSYEGNIFIVNYNQITELKKKKKILKNSTSKFCPFVTSYERKSNHMVSLPTTSHWVNHGKKCVICYCGLNIFLLCTTWEAVTTHAAAGTLIIIISSFLICLAVEAWYALLKNTRVTDICLSLLSTWPLRATTLLCIQVVNSAK